MTVGRLQDSTPTTYPRQSLTPPQVPVDHHLHHELNPQLNESSPSPNHSLPPSSLTCNLQTEGDPLFADFRVPSQDGKKSENRPLLNLSMHFFQVVQEMRYYKLHAIFNYVGAPPMAL